MRSLLLAAIALVLTATPLQADERPVDFTTLPELSLGALNTGNSAVSIHAGTDKKTAKFQFGVAPLGERLWKWDISLEAPYDADSDPAVLGDFDGLSKSTNLSLNVSRINIQEAEYPNELDAAIKALCADYAGSVDDQCTTGEIEERIIKKKDPGKLCANRSDAECKEIAKQVSAQFVIEKRRLEQVLIDQEVIQPVKARILGLKGTVGVQQFKYSDPTTLDAIKKNQSPWAFDAYLHFMRGNTVYGGGLAYKESYKEKPEVSVCTPLPTPAGASSCQTTRLGAPQRERRKLLYLEVHHHRGGQYFAIAPRISFDFEKDKLGINVPIYLVRSEKGLFTGGLQIGWQSEDDEVVAGFFVGKAFAYF